MKYANLFGYSDVTPYEIIKETAKTISIREMDAVIDPTFKPEYVQGGFAGNCINQQEQKWVITSNPEHPVIKAYLRKDGYYWSKYGKHIQYRKPVKYYDFNF
jgi:hypothetical protein